MYRLSSTTLIDILQYFLTHLLVTVLRSALTNDATFFIIIIIVYSSYLKHLMRLKCYDYVLHDHKTQVHQGPVHSI